MSELTDDRKREITEGLCDWLRLPRYSPTWYIPHQGINVLDNSGRRWWFNPLESLDDAHLLLLECDKRGLIMGVADQIAWMLEDGYGTNGPRLVSAALLATPAQITTAIAKVVKNLPKEDKPC